MSVSLDIRLARLDFSLDFQAEMPDDGLTALFGPSGCGKTTVLRAIAGFEPQASGRISFAGADWSADGAAPPAHKRGVGFVFQDARLFPHLSVEGNLRYASSRAKRAGRAPDFDAVIKALDLAPLLQRRTAGLSGGERQRAAIGRALLTAPRILLLDEPLSALDEKRREEIMPYLERLRESARIPVILVSHSLSEVARLASFMVAMREGKVVRAGPLDDLLADPAFTPVIGPAMAGAVLSGRVIRRHADGLTELSLGGLPVFLPDCEAAPGALIRFRVHADDVMIGVGEVSKISALNILPAEVEMIHEGAGPGAMVALRAGGQRLLARLTRRSLTALSLAPGAQCYAIMKTVAVVRAEVGAGL